MALLISELNSQTTYRAGSNAPADADSRIRGAEPTLVFQVTGSTAAINWDDGGAGGSFSLSGTNNSIAAYTPMNKTQSVVITASNVPNGSDTYAINIEATMPIQPQVQFEVELDMDTKVKTAKDKTPYFREDGPMQLGWTFGFDKRQLDSRDELFEFFRNHRKVVQFWVVDTEGEVLNKVWFISSVKAIFDGANRWNMAVGVRGFDQNLSSVAVTESGITVTEHGVLVTSG